MMTLKDWFRLYGPEATLPAPKRARLRLAAPIKRSPRPLPEGYRDTILAINTATCSAAVREILDDATRSGNFNVAFWAWIRLRELRAA